MIDKRLALRFALRAIGVGVLLGFGALLGIAVAWKWPLNFAGAIGLTFLGYCCGRVHEGDIATRPSHTITSLPIAPLPKARTRRRSDV